jgi:hypothetical protein
MNRMNKMNGGKMRKAAQIRTVAAIERTENERPIKEKNKLETKNRYGYTTSAVLRLHPIGLIGLIGRGIVIQLCTTRLVSAASRTRTAEAGVLSRV